MGTLCCHGGCEVADSPCKAWKKICCIIFGSHFQVLSSCNMILIHSLIYRNCYIDAVPKIEAPLKVEGIVAHGKRITLTCKCKATGKPKFHFTWLHDDIEIPEINNSKFTIDSMDESDEGEYKCKVSNEVGSAISEAVTLKPGTTLSFIVAASCKCMQASNTLHDVHALLFQLGFI